MTAIQMNILKCLLGRANYHNLKQNMLLGLYATGHMAQPASELLQSPTLTRLLCSSRDHRSYCRLVTTLAPGILPAVLRFVVRQKRFYNDAINRLNSLHAAMTTDTGLRVSDTVFEIMSVLTRSGYSMPKATFTRRKAA